MTLTKQERIPEIFRGRRARLRAAELAYEYGISEERVLRSIIAVKAFLADHRDFQPARSGSGKENRHSENKL